MVAGEEFIDTVTIGDLVIENQGIGVGELTFGFNGVDGILGCVRCVVARPESCLLTAICAAALAPWT